jgi:hypothetical protein
MSDTSPQPAERALARRIGELERERAELLARLGHELRTPLNGVLGFAGLLRRNRSGTLQPEDLALVDRIASNGRRMLELLDGLLETSRSGRRQVELDLAPAALDALVRDTVAQLQDRVVGGPVTLAAEVPPQTAPVYTDAEKLAQVLRNLVGNAIKFTPRGAITVRLHADPATNLPRRIDVIDTGIGIDGEHLESIFDPWHGEADDAVGATGGLGLQLSRAFCEAMGYRLTVASALGGGSVFSVVLGGQETLGGGGGIVAGRPGGGAAPEPGGAPGSTTPMPSPPSTASTRGLAVLIDDDVEGRLQVARALRALGFEVVMTASAAQGLQMARDLRPHLIAVDLMAPALAGLDVVAEVRGDPVLGGTPLVVVSAMAGEYRPAVPGIPWIAKPVSAESLGAAVIPVTP